MISYCPQFPAPMLSTPGHQEEQKSSLFHPKLYNKRKTPQRGIQFSKDCMEENITLQEKIEDLKQQLLFRSPSKRGNLKSLFVYQLSCTGYQLIYQEKNPQHYFLLFGRLATIYCKTSIFLPAPHRSAHFKVSRKTLISLINNRSRILVFNLLGVLIIL